MGKHFTNVVDVTVRDGNAQHPIVTSSSLFDGNLDFLCRDQTQMSKKKFCTKNMLSNTTSCGTNHRNGQKEKINLSENVFLAKVPGKDDGLMHPMGNAENFIESDLNA